MPGTHIVETGLLILKIIGEALDDALTAGFLYFPEHRRVGQREVGGRHGVHDHAAVELDLHACGIVHALGLIDHLTQPVAVQQVGLFDEAKDGI